MQCCAVHGKKRKDVRAFVRSRKMLASPEKESVESTGQAAPKRPKRIAYDPQDLPEYLNVYYKRLFPYGLFYRWLSYGNGIRRRLRAHYAPFRTIF